jgi:hypothetical protein
MAADISPLTFFLGHPVQPFHIDSGVTLALPSAENSNQWATISVWDTVS